MTRSRFSSMILLSCLAAMSATALADPGVPGDVLRTAEASVGPACHLSTVQSTPPSDFPWNPDYWTFGCGEVSVEVPADFYLRLAEATLADGCFAVCKPASACYSLPACNTYKNCAKTSIQNLWDGHEGMEAAIAACCLQHPGGGEDLVSCINFVVSSNYPGLDDDLDALLACCPTCTQ